MFIDHWPLFGLRLTTPRLELRLPSEEELAALADLAAEGVHDPDRMPFTVPWTDLPPRERARSVFQHHWLQLGKWAPDDWTLNFAVFEHGRIVGQQAISARAYATLHEVGTGSWIGLRHQGRGIGTEMRAAVLHLAFDGLRATDAVSGAFADNPSSFRVSEKLGYEPDGIQRLTVREKVTVMRRVRLSRTRWESHQRTTVGIEGLTPCLPLFGAA
ncbi:GNAT family N-acetyltransferase [Nocardia salmonicida]|uniref:GNAT family N-acetyltransferase n=1 Tax=Nocardia salmonicida TaxID=53431 RepID=UPI0037B6660D